MNGLLSQHTNTSNHSSLLPPLINIFTPITSFPFSQLLSAAPVTGNFNCVSSSTDETRRINFSSSSLNHPRPPPLSRNSLYSCANENVLCQYKNNNEAFECRENSSCNNSKSSTSSQQTNNPSSFFFHQQVSSHPGSNAHQQFFMSSRGRRPANTQTSSNQRSVVNTFAFSKLTCNFLDYIGLASATNFQTTLIRGILASKTSNCDYFSRYD